MNEDSAILLLYEAIDELNPRLPPGMQVEKSPATVLFGDNGRLDSLGLVNLIVATEEKIEDQLGVTISLADEKAISLERSPFGTIEAFANYIKLLLDEHHNG